MTDLHEDILTLVRQTARRWRGQVTREAFQELMVLEMQRYVAILQAKGDFPQGVWVPFTVNVDAAGERVRVEVYGCPPPIIVDITQETHFVPVGGVE